MKIIVAGSREIDSRDLIYSELLKLSDQIDITEIVSGKARGPDTIGEEWANLERIPVKEFPADWDNWGKSAGFIRNEEMANYADELFAFWDGKSQGTKHMIKSMLERNKPFQVILVR